MGKGILLADEGGGERGESEKTGNSYHGQREKRRMKSSVSKKGPKFRVEKGN